MDNIDRIGGGNGNEKYTQRTTQGYEIVNFDNLLLKYNIK